MDHRQDLIDFLQRAIGYTLTGSTREQCLFILYGVTKTGKSTFLATLRALLGPYGQQADMDSFMHKDRQEVRNDLADLAGSRCVCALEAQEGKRLAESLVKQLTGGVDLIKARFLFQEHFTFKPQFKLFLGTNHKPVIKDTDSAIWERIRLVPFTVQIPKEERDKTLDEQLQAELPGILAWAVRGCQEWQRLRELQEPAAVVEATAGYRKEMDDIGRFLEEVCYLGKAEYQTQASVLLKAYHAWCGQTTLSSKTLAQRLSEKSYVAERKTTGMFWQCIGLPADIFEKEDKKTHVGM
jgi:putative DNA primase/helicase